MLKNYANLNAYYSAAAPLQLLEKAEEQCEVNYHIQRACSPIYALEYILEGQNEFHINGESFVAEAGDVVFLPKNSCHSYGSVKNCPCRKQWFVFDGGFVAPMAAYYLPQNKYRFRAEGAKEIFSKITALSIAGAEEYADAVREFSLLLYTLFMAISAFEQKQNQPQESAAEQMKRYIDENILEKITLGQLAEAFHYSKNHTIVLFREQFGITPNQYLLNRKIELACLYLRNTNLSVKAVSELLHFADQHYFSNVFFKVKKMYPRDYRKSLEEPFSKEEILPSQKPLL